MKLTKRELEVLKEARDVIDRILTEIGGNSGSEKVKRTEEIKSYGSVEEAVTDYIHYIGIPAHIKGYQYIQDAIMLTIEDPKIITGITKLLYPTIAKKYQTTPSKVERAIRHAKEVAVKKGNQQEIDSLFGFTQMPKNGEFIAEIAVHIRRKHMHKF